MSETIRVQTFPRGALIAATGLISLSIVAAGAGRLTGLGVTRMPTAPAVQSRALHFDDRADGGVQVTDASRHIVAVLPPGTNGFARGVLRGLARARRQEAIGAEPPFILTRWADGRLTLKDPSTNQHVSLEAFGATNSEVFARLLTGEGRP
jgi:putative photosynthetic complex assembly protein